MGYDPNEAEKSYVTLFKERSLSSFLKTCFLILFYYFYNTYILKVDTSIFVYCLFYLVFMLYFIYKPKFIRFLKDRG